MKSLLLKIVVLFVPFVLIVCGTNYIIDPVHMFGKRARLERAVVDYILDGHNVGLRRFPIRRIQNRLLVKKRLQPFDVLVIGSSRARSVGAALFPNRSLMNANLEFATVKDLAATYQLYIDANLEPSTVVVGIDAVMFMKTSGYHDWKLLGDEYLKIRQKLMPVGVFARTALQAEISSYRAKELFSIKNFRRSTRLLTKLDADEPIEKLVWPVENIARRQRTLRADGTILAKRFFRTRAQTTIDRRAGLANPFPFAMEKDRSVYRENDELIRNFVKYLVAEEKEVILALHPYHPVIFKRVRKHAPVVIEMEETLRTLAKELGLRIVGSYDPERAGCLNTDFLDDVHLRDSCVSKMFAKP